jgi:phosphate starvation-inducible PhoH-like protein
MKMFLTRLGYDSKAVITGDVTQVDLPDGRKSGLSDAIRLLANVEGISINRFSDVDVVRHPLVQRIIRAYDARAEQQQQQRRDTGYRGDREENASRYRIRAGARDQRDEREDLDDERGHDEHGDQGDDALED